MPTVWRIVKSRHAPAAFDGEGARLAGGRWNPRGAAMVYTSECAALAVLEVLAHLQNASVLTAYSLLSVELAARDIERLDPASLPPRWRAYPALPELQAIGERWLLSARSLALQVPSAVVDEHANYLLNPAHPHAATLRPSPPRPFELDLRLLRAP